MFRQVFYLYIDPGTGSMLFTVILGLVTALLFALRGFWIKIKTLFSGKNSDSLKSLDTEKLSFVIYTDSKRYWNVFKPICDEFERRKIPLMYLTQSKDDAFFFEKYKYVKGEYIGDGNASFAKLNSLRANTVISSTPGLDVYQWKRSKYVDRYIHIYHDATSGTAYEMFALDYYDEVLLTGDFQERYIRILEDKRNLPHKKVYTTGSVYLDELLKRSETVSKDDTKIKDNKTVLLAPSWGKGGILFKFGDRILRALVETGYNIIVRPHPQSVISESDMLNTLMKEFPENDKFHWNFDDNNFEVLKISDILISDFSGVIFDFALVFNRPIIYADTQLDLAPYDAAWIDEPYWMLETLPSIGKPLVESEFVNMKEVIDSTLSSDVYSEGRLKAKSTVWNYVGDSLTRTVDYILESKNDVK